MGQAEDMLRQQKEEEKIQDRLLILADMLGTGQKQVDALSPGVCAA